MAEAENIAVEVKVDVSDIDSSLKEMSGKLGMLQNSVVNLSKEVSAGFKTNLAATQGVRSEVRQSATMVASAVGVLMNAVTGAIGNLATKLDNIYQTVGSIKSNSEQQKGNNFLSSLGDKVTDKAVDIAGQYVYEKIGGGKKQGDGSDEDGGPNSSGASGLVGGGVNSLMGGDLGGMFPDVASMQELAEGISGVVTKLKESATAWASQTAAKVADKAEDLQILALYAADYVKSFGAMVVHLAQSTAAWVSNTAAKAASTVAEWAQIAATTAWQGICVAATAVTTAFGAAMAFLTSPIGLVVVAITALIAIVVLLVENWDTVKATAERVWTFIQGLFEKFDGFLQNIFAKDFTEQFGAFGNILNAFFANAENMWNAVKTIFGGIIDFVKNVFKGEWGAAWDGIVKIFKGIWDGIVAVAKAPINAIIGIINGLIAGVIAGINGVIGMLNKLNFKIPDWVPGLGGKSFGFNLKTVTAPQIPYLAKGAVLPANRPFLAMVGDQRHGTNVEAPLATIQEAVAVVLNEQMAAMMGGFRAIVEEQRATRATIENIEVGDTVIGQAARRYNARLATAGIR